MRVTIKDVAKKAGLSPATVSLALNGKGERLSPRTVQAALDAARELDYRPDQNALNLITHRSNAIGLILPDICNAVFARIAHGAQERCQEDRYHLILCNSDGQPQKDVEYCRVLADRGVDGMLLVLSPDTGGYAAECSREIRKAQVPVVLIDRESREIAAPAVCTDHELGALLVVRHLLELGHRKIGCISGPPGVPSAQQRMRGYRRALWEYGIEQETGLMVEGDYRTESGYWATERLLEQGVTAIFACNDLMACGVYRYAVEHGIQIPKNLSVAGFDDAEFSDVLAVPLTTVRQPSFTLGRAAAERLIAQIRGETVPQEPEVFPPELKIRASTCPPKSV